MPDDFTNDLRARLIRMVNDYQLSADDLTENLPISHEAAEQILENTSGPREQLRDWLITQLETPLDNPFDRHQPSAASSAAPSAGPIPEPPTIAAPSIGVELAWMSDRLSLPAQELLANLAAEADESLQGMAVNLAPLDLRHELAHHQLVTGSQDNVQLTLLGRAIAERLSTGHPKA